MKKTSTDPLVSFIVLGWNNKSLLPECLDSIYNQTYSNFNAVYVDNGSADESLEYVKKNYSQAIRVDAGKNLGFAIGNNLGIKRALQDNQCAYVALLNTDATLENDWLETLITFALKHPHSASFQAPTYDYYNHTVLDSYGITVDHYGRAIQLGYRQNEPKLKTQIVFGTNAAANLISREFLDIQPFGDDYFDSDLWMYLEDVDLAARATMMGWSNWFVNKSKAYHMGSASSSKNPGFSVFRIYRNNLLMLIKNLPLAMLLKAFPGMIVTDARTLWNLLKSRNFIAAKALFRGRLYCVPMIPRFITKRYQLKKFRAITKQSLIELMGVR